jgi:hypothetical protein
VITHREGADPHRAASRRSDASLERDPVPTEIAPESAALPCGKPSLPRR